MYVYFHIANEKKTERFLHLHGVVYATLCEYVVEYIIYNFKWDRNNVYKRTVYVCVCVFMEMWTVSVNTFEFGY